MSKPVSRETKERRNGCDIDWVVEEIDLAGGGTTKAGGFEVLTTSKPRRIIGKRVSTLKEAQDIADKQPAPKE